MLFIVERIISWRGIKRRELNEELIEVEFSKESAMELLGDQRKSWLFAQCLDFLTNANSFQPKGKS